MRVVKWLSGIGVGLFLFGFLFSGFVPLPVRIVWPLATGWIGFLKRVLPQVTLNWSGVGMVILCSVLIVAGTHWICSWLYAHLAATRNPAARWRWQWTTSLYAALWLLFLAAMGVTGVTHQVGWLVASKEPLYAVRWNFYPRLKSTGLDLHRAAENEGWDLAKTRKAFLERQGPPSSRNPNPLEDMHLLFLEGRDGKLAAAIAFYRDQTKRGKSGFVCVTPDGGNPLELHDMTKLPEALSRYEAGGHQPGLPAK